MLSRPLEEVKVDFTLLCHSGVGESTNDTVAGVYYKCHLAVKVLLCSTTAAIQLPCVYFFRVLWIC